MNYAELSGAVAQDAALRRRQRLQPVGGEGDKLFPPTYPGEGRNAGPRHVLERRRVAGEDVWCALVDSVQSQANRLEEALLNAVREGAVVVPHVTVDFRPAQLAGLTEITSLDAPHRVYDAILRDSLLDGQAFPKSELGVRLAEAKPGAAAALLEVSPTALLFGAWNSTGEGGGLGAKFPRALVSEIAAVGVSVEQAETLSRDRNGGMITSVDVANAGRRTGSRIDPLGILRRVEVYQGEGKAWDVDQAKAGKKAKRVKPSEINHGNIAPSVQALGITCDYAEHTAVISFAGLRRLGFGGGEKDAAGRTYLAALGLFALAEQDARGYALRSRCDLVCEGRAPLQRVQADGSTPEVDLDREGARALYREAYDRAKAVGLALRDTPVRLVPQDKLVNIVRQSQHLALSGEGGDQDEAKVD
ncbi:type I-U CRISPR-associated RAMP protein Csb1/Cas7u [Caulobacter sp. S45]|uniref:type I-G CRISPR-associated RAMP protein Csb1/Cas7g n=1 Tax=Caulobacter sp. S45 TaxID=1641861 RepID=UPI0015761792|nr:type I-U CRISPR-associated RAMP protein Csb1/Cas7u [Caulobacter sp. S45]